MTAPGPVTNLHNLDVNFLIMEPGRLFAAAIVTL